MSNPLQQKQKLQHELSQIKYQIIIIHTFIC